MNKLKFAFAALAAGAAFPAAAATTVVTDTFGFVGYGDGTPFHYDVTLSKAPSVNLDYVGTWELLLAGATSDSYSYAHRLRGNGTVLFAFGSSTTPGFNTDISEYTKNAINTYDPGFATSVPTGSPGPDNTPAPDLVTSTIVDPSTYWHLMYEVGGEQYYGYAQVDAAETLVSVTYQAVAVPEPESWALLILGSGLAGATLRRARRMAQTATARS